MHSFCPDRGGLHQERSTQRFFTDDCSALAKPCAFYSPNHRRSDCGKWLEATGFSSWGGDIGTITLELCLVQVLSGKGCEQ